MGQNSVSAHVKSVVILIQEALFSLAADRQGKITYDLFIRVFILSVALVNFLSGDSDPHPRTHNDSQLSTLIS